MSNLLVKSDQAVSIVRAAQLPNLSYIPSGPIPPNPAELLGSSRMNDFIRAMEQKFDFLIFDTPPVGNVTDAAVLSKYVPNVVMVVRSFATQREHLKMAREVFSKSNSKILGAVINNADIPAGANFSYDSYYYQHYYYGEDVDKSSKPRKSKSAYVRGIMIDLHAHILPGLDDGPKDVSESLEMCRLAQMDGVTTMVAAPHMNDGVYDVSRQTLLDSVSTFQDQLITSNIQLKVVPGGDVHASPDLLEKIEAGNAMTVGDLGKHIILELPSDVLPEGLADLLFKLQVAGITPIISHPERNGAIQAKPELAQSMVKAGALLQATAASIVGDFGSTVQQCAHDLLKRGLVHLVATDMHSIKKRPPGRMSSARRIVAQLLSDEQADEIFDIRPEKILAGEHVEVEDLPKTYETEKKGIMDWLLGR